MTNCTYFYQCSHLNTQWAYWEYKMLPQNLQSDINFIKIYNSKTTAHICLYETYNFAIFFICYILIFIMKPLYAIFWLFRFIIYQLKFSSPLEAISETIPARNSLFSFISNKTIYIWASQSCAFVFKRYY